MGEVYEAEDKVLERRVALKLLPADGDAEARKRMLREARIHMTQEGTYDPTMMNIMKRVRCKHDPANEECGTFDE